MVTRGNDPRGILNDWDLAHICAKDGSTSISGERTGTVPFMALDLLAEAYWDGKIKRLFCHDLEGFIWILPWVFLQFNGNKLTNPVLRSWRTGDYKACHKEKKEFLYEEFLQCRPMGLWTEEWSLAIHLLGWLRAERVKQGDADIEALSGVEPDDEPDNKMVYCQFRETVEKAVGKRQLLSYVLELLPENIS